MALLENLRFLAGYRRAWLFDPMLLDALRMADLDGATLAEAFTSVLVFDPDAVRSSVFHLLWSGWLTTDLDRPLGSAHVLRRRS
ncbi:hypothetical protein OG887_00300 [Streptomyces sp. NBC_00053]|uniref:hypothetical protein n=1 Tax=unclassified Streptomyces TaxID=2593676 RepID=UPI00225BD1EB|nr:MULTISPECIES: hypothetical protein [unclassified Streptomyces]MCX5497925.1 hypothetical protein [Streptomyces sp. NBC_00052]MCX5553545.1 hypothetical protein [Streptomyces sp. NBC_00051]